MRKKSVLALSLSIAAGSLMAPFVYTSPVYGAETNAGAISKDEAVALAHKYATIPEGYTLESHRLQNESIDFATPTWSLHFAKAGTGVIHFTIDSKSGKLISFSQHKEGPYETSGQAVNENQAEQIARKFLQKVADPRELERLSDANEYEHNAIHFGMADVQSFLYTRVENEIPFPENFFQMAVDREGNVTQFIRRWHDGKLPSANALVSLEQAQQKLAVETKPSLSFVRLSERVGDYGPGEKPYSLVYQYGPNDGVMVDATSGSVLNAQGQTISDAANIQPLGRSEERSATDVKRINIDEAEKIADEIIKRFPGSFTSEGNTGSGTTTGSDGMTWRSWSFSYVPMDGNNGEHVRLEIDDTGQVSGFSNDESRFIGPSRKVDNPISWDEAKDRAIEIIQILYPDQLGELYLRSEKPTDDALEQLLELGGGGYSITFGRLKNGIPVENATLQVEINAETGKIMHLWSRSHRTEWPQLDTLKPSIDADQAKRIAAEKQEIKLAYFQPSITPYGVPETTEPMLVYRNMGEIGVVDAVNEEWISLRALREGQQPQDIDQHPSKEALLFAIQQRILKTENGQVKPDQTVTRGELVSMIVPFANQLSIHMRTPIYRDEQQHTFQDVDENSALHSSIQQAIRMGIVPKEGGAFRPNAEVSRIEFAEMVARLVGYEKLLTKPDIFKTNYEDVAPRHVPAVALSEALELWKHPEAEFKPNQKVTRAEVAEVMYRLSQTFRR